MIGNQHIMRQHYFTRQNITARLGTTGFVLALLAGSAAVFAGFGSRWGVWHFTTGFMVLKWAAIGGAAAVLLSLTGGIAAGPGTDRPGFLQALAGILLGLLIAGIPLSWMRTAQQMPPIHDITTDPANPPAFVSIMPLRANADNTAEYGGPDVAAMQRAAYPDIRPAVLPAPPLQAFAEALAVAKDMGWKIVAANVSEGRIEAMATTFWFGFKDDIVVRITPVGEGSKVDIRSVSRVGRGDIGTNARRIRAFLHKLTDGDIIGT